jgi:RNA 2',3'-cyclic 3'-phosphodiesterase
VSGERARLFVALELPGDVRSELVRWRGEALRHTPGLREVEPASLHVTLCFLGLLPVSEIGRIGAATAGALDGEPGAGGLSLAAALWLPERRPRVLAVALDDPSGRLARLQSLIADALSAGGWYTPEERPFVAHATVARVGRGARVRPVPIEAPPAVAFDGSTVTLFRSRPGGAGARYEPLRSARL